MSITQAAARRAVLGAFHTAWDTTGFKAFYGDVPPGNPPAEDIKLLLPWARVELRFKDQNQAAFGHDGHVKFKHAAELKIEIRGPSGKGMAGVEPYVQTVLAAFRAKAVGLDEVWFGRILQDQGPDGVWFMSMLMIEVLFYELT